MKTIYSALLCLFSLYSLTGQNPIVTTLTDQFNGSGGVKLGPDGFLYVADFGAALSNANGNQIWRINPSTGDRTVFATGFQGASGNDFDSQGNLFQSNISGGYISKVTPGGSVSTFASAGIVGPVGIAIDDDDNLFVCNCSDNTIRKVTSQGVSTLFSSGAIFNCPNGITMDSEGMLYVSNFGNSVIVKISPNGQPIFFASVPGSNNGHLTYHEPDNMIYANSHGSSSIYTITLQGVVTKIAGSGIRGNADGAASVATFSRPNGIAVSTTGDTIWVNSSIPTVDNPNSNFYPLNPSVVRMVTGLKEPSSTDETLSSPFSPVSITPNPASISTVIEFTPQVSGQLTMSVFSLNGELIQTHEMEVHKEKIVKKEINVDAMPEGMYVLSIVGEEYAVNKKFVVDR